VRRRCGFSVPASSRGDLSATKLQGAIDGFALAQGVRERFGGIEVILTTGIAMTAEKADCPVIPT
jgi:hypothetical protein